LGGAFAASSSVWEWEHTSAEIKHDNYRPGVDATSLSVLGRASTPD